MTRSQEGKFPRLTWEIPIFGLPLLDIENELVAQITITL
jgi:hypothetical protein